MRHTGPAHVVSGLIRGLLAVGLVVGLARCDFGTAPPNENALVAEAFLETNRPLPAVILRRTTGLAGTANDVASGGTVTITLNGTTISYQEQGASGRYVPTADSVVRPRAPWQLEAEWEGTTVQARGRVPDSITVTEVCLQIPAEPVQAVRVDSVRRDSLDIPATTDLIFPIDVTVRWPSNLSAPQADTSYWVRTQLRPEAASFSSEIVSFFLEPITVRREDAFQQTGTGRKWSGVYAVPVDSTDSDLLPTHNLTTALVRGDTSFAAFAQTRTDPEQRAPISNVEGGLGIATALSIDSLRIGAITTPGTQRCQQP